MATQTKENYLKAIYFLDKKDHKISITELGNEMEVSTPTANNMVKNLESLGYVNYQKYKPLTLTDEGRKVAALVVRKHRLSEMFLSKIMGFGWEEVHDIAEEIEHIKSEAFFDRMDELLGYPRVDPHGSPIPDKQGHVPSSSYVNLSNIGEGREVIFKALTDSSTDLLLFLNDKELTLGTVLRLEKREKFDQSIYISYKGYENIMLSNEVAKRLLVKVN